MRDEHLVDHRDRFSCCYLGGPAHQEQQWNHGKKDDPEQIKRVNEGHERGFSYDHSLEPCICPLQRGPGVITS